MSEIHEKVALREIIDKKASGLFESAFVHEVMSELKSRENEWENMDVGGETIQSDCKKAVKIVADKMIEHDQKAYKANIMQIATAVAAAFREFDEKAGLLEKISTYFRLGIDKLLGKAIGETYQSEMLLNISLEEDMVLSKLAEALDFNAGKALPEKQ